MKVVTNTKEAAMQYESPEMIELGPVEDLTFGGEVWPSLDRITGARGFGGLTPADDDNEV
jgi:hypothetical protein